MADIKKCCNLTGKCEKCEGIGVCYGVLAIVVLAVIAIVYFLF